MIFLQRLASNEAWIWDNTSWFQHLRRNVHACLIRHIRIRVGFSESQVVALILEEDNAIKQNSDLETCMQGTSALWFHELMFSPFFFDMFLCLRLPLSSDESGITYGTTCIHLHNFTSIQQLCWSHSPFSRLSGLKCRVFSWGRCCQLSSWNEKHVSWGIRSRDLAACLPFLLLRSWMCSARRFWDIILTCQNRFLHPPAIVFLWTAREVWNVWMRLSQWHQEGMEQKNFIRG